MGCTANNSETRRLPNPSSPQVLSPLGGQILDVPAFASDKAFHCFFCSSMSGLYSYQQRNETVAKAFQYHDSAGALMYNFIMDFNKLTRHRSVMPKTESRFIQGNFFESRLAVAVRKGQLTLSLCHDLWAACTILSNFCFQKFYFSNIFHPNLFPFCCFWYFWQALHPAVFAGRSQAF